MKALSIIQPWASLISEGFKTIETRVWPTEYRGELLICSSKKPDKNLISQFTDLFTPIELDDFPCGVALAMANLCDCKPMVKEDEEKALCSIYGEGRWKAKSFFLKDIRKIQPIPVIGQLGIFDIDIKLDQIKTL